MAKLFPPGYQFLDLNGQPVNGGGVVFYQNGTTTIKGVFTDTALSVAATNSGTSTPKGAPLDSAGRFTQGDLYGSGAYTVVLEDSSGSQIWSRDDFIALATVSNTTYYELGTTASGQAHPGIVTGHLIETNYFDSNRVSDSGGLHRFSGTTTAGNAGNWPNADGFFYDTDGKQFKAVGPRFRVQQFGALVDGATDDAAAIKAALINGVAVLPQGTCVVASKIEIPTNGGLVGDSAEKSIIKTLTDIIPVAAATDADRWIARDFNIYTSTNTTDAGFDVPSGNDRWSISNVRVDNAGGGAFNDGFTITGATIGHLDHCTANDCLQYGYNIESSSNAINLISCIGENNTTAEVFGSASDGIVILGGTYQGTTAPDGISFSSVDSSEIIGPWIEEDAVSAFALKLSSCTGIRASYRHQGGEATELIDSDLNFIGPIVGSPVTTTLDATSNQNFLMGQFDATDITDSGSGNVFFTNLGVPLFTKNSRVNNLAFSDTNSEYIDMLWASNVAEIMTNQIGSGSARVLRLGTVGAADLQLSTTDTQRWVVQSTGDFLAASDGSYSIGAETSNDPKNISLTEYLAGREMTAPGVPAANGYRLFAVDSGGGKTVLKVQFATGAAQTLATEP